MKRKHKLYTVKVNSFIQNNKYSAKAVKIQMKMSETQLTNYIKFLEEQKRKEQETYDRDFIDE